MVELFGNMSEYENNNNKNKKTNNKSTEAMSCGCGNVRDMNSGSTRNMNNGSENTKNVNSGSRSTRNMNSGSENTRNMNSGSMENINNTMIMPDVVSVTVTEFVSDDYQDCNNCVMNMVGLAQAYVPFQGKYTLLSECRSLLNGTVFQQLVMPYKEKRL